LTWNFQSSKFELQKCFMCLTLDWEWQIRKISIQWLHFSFVTDELVPCTVHYLSRLHIKVFWVMVLRSEGVGYQLFKGGAAFIFRVVSIVPHLYTMSQPKRPPHMNLYYCENMSHINMNMFCFSQKHIAKY